MMLAIAISKGRIAPLFDTARHFQVLHLGNDEHTADTELRLEVEGGPARVTALLQRDVNTIICGAITTDLSANLERHGVRVEAFVSGDVERVVEAFLAGTLNGDAFSMPGCARQQRRCRRGRRGHEP